MLPGARLMAFELDRDGGAEVLKELSAAAIKDLADQIADQIGQGAKVKIYTTDRAAATVSVPAEMQAKDGVLTRAAAAAGLQVRPKPATETRNRGKSRKARPEATPAEAKASGDANEAWAARRRAQRKAGR
ncbi:hypothetical protein D2E53_08520 [Mycobacteroides abscessus]|nr:hypothetical protein D2E37_08520 [Mycobacteroides abscessus]RIS86445.1 hypothetical protein D2E53_08520 [Mycobacteroides abscessus]